MIAPAPSRQPRFAGFAVRLTAAAGLAALSAAIIVPALAQSAPPAPAASPATTPPPAATPSPAPAPSPSATPAPAPTPVAPPADAQAPTPTPPAAAQTPAAPAPATQATPPAAQAPAAPAPNATVAADPFGEELTLTSKSVVILKGAANWDTAFDTITDALKTLTAFLDKQGLKASGNAMIVYTSTDDTGFNFQAELPLEQTPKNLGKDMSMGKSPEGKALKFVHRGSYDNMDNTYEAITNHLDDKRLEAKDMFVEEYITDPLKTAEDKLVINVYVPLK